MSLPTENDGSEAIARVKVAIAYKVLQTAMADLPLGSKEESAVLKAMTALSKFADGKEDGFIPAEIQQMLQSLPHSGGGSPTQQAMQAPPGGAPPQAPPQPGLM